ncbi:MAG: ABC transporter permease [Porphyromonadaceae bacterium]|uniref:ABC transporter permease n=1 Tax=uncultured Porphyromonas sp. TaxID=159274 RepID=UPI001CAE84C2|nr:FtsX-like permease family protein [uncultured Porphyromonas sp.]MBF1373821.1 ABC transporter permease [Porphyromonadaceae bacterium]MBF1381207.1 ABC transporter permease [Porphyromonadaceae bacterium]
MALFSSATTFLSRGLSRGDKAGTRRVSALLRLTTIGVALSLSVMLLSVTIILGFHRQIHEFAFSQTGHISLNGYGSNWKTSTTPVYVSPELLSFLREEKGVSSVSPLIQQAGLLKTEGDFSGILLYGIDSTFRSRYFTEQVKSGTLPSFSESEYSRPPIVLPSHVARRMNYKVGDAVRIYFFGEKMRVRVFELQAIYESTGLELSPALCPISSLQRLNHWDENTYSRLIIMLQDPDAAYPTLDHLISTLQARPDLIGEENYGLNLGQELQPELFNWLAFLDTNVYALLSLMVLVGGFAMITGLIIIVLDKSKQIGILKALGATNRQLRQTFLQIAARLILRGIFWGNAIALVLSLAQRHFKIIKLNPANYFTDSVPIYVDLPLWVAINVGTLIVILLMVLVPASLVSRIHPAESMRMD